MTNEEKALVKQIIETDEKVGKIENAMCKNTKEIENLKGSIAYIVEKTEKKQSPITVEELKQKLSEFESKRQELQNDKTNSRKLNDACAAFYDLSNAYCKSFESQLETEIDALNIERLQMIVRERLSIEEDHKKALEEAEAKLKELYSKANYRVTANFVKTIAHYDTSIKLAPANFAGERRQPLHTDYKAECPDIAGSRELVTNDAQLKSLDNKITKLRRLQFYLHVDELNTLYELAIEYTKDLFFAAVDLFLQFTPEKLGIVLENKSLDEGMAFLSEIHKLTKPVDNEITKRETLFYTNSSYKAIMTYEHIRKIIHEKRNGKYEFTLEEIASIASEDTISGAKLAESVIHEQNIVREFALAEGPAISKIRDELYDARGIVFSRELDHAIEVLDAYLKQADDARKKASSSEETKSSMAVGRSGTSSSAVSAIEQKLEDLAAKYGATEKKSKEQEKIVREAASIIRELRELRRSEET